MFEFEDWAEGDTLDEEKVTIETEKLLTFIIANKMYALPIDNVREILEMPILITLPMMPRFILGAINVREQLIPLVDFAIRMGIEPEHKSSIPSVIIHELPAEKNSAGSTRCLALKVDEVKSFVELTKSELNTTFNAGSEVPTNFMKAMCKIEDEHVPILNIMGILSVKDLLWLDSSVTEVVEEDFYRELEDGAEDASN